MAQRQLPFGLHTANCVSLITSSERKLSSGLYIYLFAFSLIFVRDIVCLTVNKNLSERVHEVRQQTIVGQNLPSFHLRMRLFVWFPFLCLVLFIARYEISSSVGVVLYYKQHFYLLYKKLCLKN